MLPAAPGAAPASAAPGALARRRLLAAALGLCTSAAIAAPAAASAEGAEQTLVDQAAAALLDLQRDKLFPQARDVLRNARAVMLAPRLIKAGFFFGGEGGSAVMLARGKSGWSLPAFYAIGSASFGLQIGAQRTELVLIIRSSKALQAMLEDKFKIGASAGLSVVTLGAEAGAATTSHLDADIVAWGSSVGAYAGLTLDGSVVQPRPQGNLAYYGQPLSPTDILLRGRGSNTGAKTLRTRLRGLA